MKLGISPNYLKTDIFDFLKTLISKLQNENVEFVLSDSVLKMNSVDSNFWDVFTLFKEVDLAKNCDVIISLGGDGTLLQSAYNLQQ